MRNKIICVAEKADRMEICMKQEKKLELYLHIPFCEKKCAYCDFLSAPADLDTRKRYVQALIEEIKIKSEAFKTYSVPSIFIGGGTPSVLVGAFIADIMEAAYASFDIEKNAEITIECNPGTLNREKTVNYKRVGINRVSMGLQSAKNEELRLLGRIHTFEQFLESYDLIRKAGIENVNVDLMSGLPGQSLQDWEYSLKKVTALGPEHISAYSLIIEEGTPFYQRFYEDERRREDGEEPYELPTEEQERAMYEWTESYLEKHGYCHYEISNYAKKGKECRHNIGYWKRENYLGLGLGSASLVENQRFCNTSDLETYLLGDYGQRELEKLSRQAQMEEFMFLGLRMLKGVSREAFKNYFGVEIEGIYGSVIKKLCTKGLLCQQEGYVNLTKEGISLSNYVMAEFLQ